MRERVKSLQHCNTRLYRTLYLFQNASLNVIQQEWFKVTSLKLSEAHQVEDYLSCFNELSRRLLEYIVNMQDSNVSIIINKASKVLHNEK